MGIPAAGRRAGRVDRLRAGLLRHRAPPRRQLHRRDPPPTPDQAPRRPLSPHRHGPDGRDRVHPSAAGQSGSAAASRDPGRKLGVRSQLRCVRGPLPAFLLCFTRGRALPANFGIPWRTVFGYFARWAKAGVLKRILDYQRRQLLPEKRELRGALRAPLRPWAPQHPGP
ncbi:hypothetical protein C3488_07330 [Streptomyces sp. Ru72]|nr:hypothetical protein C3488_07330 [Streptomyces sp. Ru72]